MYKELVISIILIIIIFLGNYVTEKCVDEAVSKETEILNELRLEIIKDDEEIDDEFSKEKVDMAHKNWDDQYEKLAYYIEHKQLEDIETELTALRGYIEKKEYGDALPELDKSMYILSHFKDKTNFNLKNIF